MSLIESKSRYLESNLEDFAGLLQLILAQLLKYTFLYKKPRVKGWGSGSAFLRISEFESQSFLGQSKFQYLVSQPFHISSLLFS